MGQRSSSVSYGWNRTADALADPFGVPNINTAAMRTAVTLVDTRCPSATRKHKRKSPHEAGFFICLAKRDGTRLHLAGRGCACTRIPSSPAGSRAGGFLRSAVTRPQAGTTGNANEKARARRAFSCVWRSGQDSPTSCRPRMRVHAHPFESRRKPRRRLPPLRSHAPASGRNPTAQTKKPARGGLLHLFGGADGTRTRDPRRDRPVF